MAQPFDGPARRAVQQDAVEAAIAIGPAGQVVAGGENDAPAFCRPDARPAPPKSPGCAGAPRRRPAPGRRGRRGRFRRPAPGNSVPPRSGPGFEEAGGQGFAFAAAYRRRARGGIVGFSRIAHPMTEESTALYVVPTPGEPRRPYRARLNRPPGGARRRPKTPATASPCSATLAPPPA